MYTFVYFYLFVLLFIMMPYTRHKVFTSLGFTLLPRASQPASGGLWGVTFSYINFYYITKVLIASKDRKFFSLGSIFPFFGFFTLFSLSIELRVLEDSFGNWRIFLLCVSGTNGLMHQIIASWAGLVL